MMLKETRWSADVEKELLDKWKKEYNFSFDPKTKKQVFTIDTPPPYPSGIWHVGAVAAYTMIDMIARTQRMRGYAVLYPFCWDRNGINIERTVETATGKSIHDFARQQFIDLCRKKINEISNEILNIAMRTGQSAEYAGENSYMTDDPKYRAFSQAVFIELFKKGLAYKDKRPNNYCPHCKTTIADAEVYHAERDVVLNFVKWKVKETGEEIQIATTRPELMCACGVVLVHPTDDRYKHLHGKTAIVPLFGKEVKIAPHKIADPQFGTGIVMECSYGDYDDIRLFRELKLKPTEAIDQNGKMTAAAGKYAGMKVEGARAAVVEDLKKAGLIAKQTKWRSRVPICERSKTPIEFIALDEWYLKQLDFLADIKKMADKIKFHQKQHKQKLFNWIDSLTIDYPISRNRYYHTEIPLWYCKKCSEIIVPPPGKYYQPWKEKPPVKKCKCGSTEFIGEAAVFDTWMDSSNSALYITRYGRDERFFKKTFPCGVRPQGYEIIRTWLYYSMLKSKLITNKPFWKHVWIHGMGLDVHGRKMSKSLGNVIEPAPLIEKYGADAFRFWAAAEVNVGDDFCVSEERINGGLKFLTKFWNIARFISSFDQAKKPAKLNGTDRWILAELEKLKTECAGGYEDFNFYVPANRVREFVWNIFAANYIEMIKARAYEKDPSALYTLHACMRAILKLLAPITPFVTDKIYSDVYNGKIHYEKFDKAGKVDEKMLALTPKLLEFNSAIWKKKKDAGLALNAQIKGTVPQELKIFEEDLTKMHRLVS